MNSCQNSMTIFMDDPLIRFFPNFSKIFVWWWWWWWYFYNAKERKAFENNDLKVVIT